MNGQYFSDNETFSSASSGDFGKISNTLLGTGALATNQGGVEQTRVPAEIQAGPNILLKNVPTFLSQLGVGVALSKTLGTQNSAFPAAVQTVGTDVGPLTNFDKDAEVQLDVFTAASAAYGSRSQKVAAAMNSVEVGPNLVALGLGAGEKYMRDRLDESLNEGVTEQFSLSKVPTAEFSAALAKATGGVRSSKDLAELIKNGRLGATTPRGLAGIDKLGQR